MEYVLWMNRNTISGQTILLDIQNENGSNDLFLLAVLELDGPYRANSFPV